MLSDAANALSELDPDSLDVDEQVDHALLTSFVDRELFELTEIRSHEWDPLRHNPGPLLHPLLARPYAPADVRLTHWPAGSPPYRTPSPPPARRCGTCRASTRRLRSGSSPARPR